MRGAFGSINTILSCQSHLLFRNFTFDSFLLWNNGYGDGGARTDTAAECTNPPYATHDWIAEHAVTFLPADEKAWLQPHMNFYRIRWADRPPCS